MSAEEVEVGVVEMGEAKDGDGGGGGRVRAVYMCPKTIQLLGGGSKGSN